MEEGGEGGEGGVDVEEGVEEDGGEKVRASILHVPHARAVFQGGQERICQEHTSNER